MAGMGFGTGRRMMQDDQITPFAIHVAVPDLLEFTGEFGAEINSFVPFV
jgi:hypothetical protein